METELMVRWKWFWWLCHHGHVGFHKKRSTQPTFKQPSCKSGGVCF